VKLHGPRSRQPYGAASSAIKCGEADPETPAHLSLSPRWVTIQRIGQIGQTNMNIKVKINQAEALRRGIDAPESTARIEIDPAQLSQDERDVIAAHMQDGHDCTPSGGYTGLPALCEPTVEGLRESIAEVIRSREEEARQKAERVVKAHEELERVLKLPPETREVGLQIDGTERSYDVAHTVTYQHQPADLSRDYCLLSEEAKARIEAVNNANKAAKKAAIAGAQPILARMREQREREQREKKDRSDKERAEILAKLPKLTQERIAAGLATDIEVTKLIRQQARVTYGLEFIRHTQSREVESITDAQFERLQGVRTQYAHIPGVKIEPRELRTYRKATEDDGPEDIDDDGEVLVDGPHIVAVLTWPVAGLDVVAHVNLDQAY
jgi:hypothetical protein